MKQLEILLMGLWIGGTMTVPGGIRWDHGNIGGNL